jgi:DNA-binding response OmpR family regulator
MKNILIVEDSQEIIDLIKIYLEQEEYFIYAACDGKTAINIFEQEEIHLVILDIMLPELNGYEVIKRIRKRSNVPVIILSAKNQDTDKILGLNLGADDYLAKPFNPLELVARINAQMRRFYDFGGSKEKQDEKVIIGDLMLDQRECKLYKKNKEIDLTYMEYKLLKLFMTEPGRVFTKAQIFELVWENEYYYTDNTVVVYISKLRDKIEDDSKNPQRIKTVRGLGYRFEK